jgi:hypothetical protein
MTDNGQWPQPNPKSSRVIAKRPKGDEEIHGHCRAEGNSAQLGYTMVRSMIRRSSGL